MGVSACAGGGFSSGYDEDETSSLEALGKADDYLSPIGQEYDLTAPVTITLSENDALLEPAAREARARELALAKMEMITRAVDDEIWKQWTEADRTGDQAIMLRVESHELDDLVALDESNYRFEYLVEAGGPRDLLQRYPFALVDGRKVLRLELGTADSPELLDLQVRVSQSTEDAYPAYMEMLEDGLDISLHVGDDHNGPVTDIAQARNTFAALVARGFVPPVASFDDLAIDSGPFRSSITVDHQGTRQVEVRIRLYHADMVEDDSLHELVDAYKESARTADIVIYKGHAGRTLSYSGVVVHYGPRASITADDFKNLELPDKYQIFVFAGCETYVGYADKMYDHPRKTTRNLDVITTVNYSTSKQDPKTLYAFFDALMDEHDGTWFPRSWNHILRAVNDVDARNRWTAMYGVHGLSDNARLSPLAEVTTVGDPCQRASDCPGVDSLCVKRSDGNKVCGAACTGTAGCPSGSTCRGVSSSTFGSLRQCLP